MEKDLTNIIDLNAYCDSSINDVPFEIKSIFKYLYITNDVLYQRFKSITTENLKTYISPKHYNKFKTKVISQTIYNQDDILIKENDLQKYIEDYAENFEKGYNEFESNMMRDASILNPSNEDLINKVFKFSTRTPQAFNYVNDFKKNEELYTKLKPTPSLKTDAINCGSIYKAWEIILKNPDKFRDIFRAYYAKSYTTLNNYLKNQNDKIEDEGLDRLMNSIYTNKLDTLIDEISKGEVNNDDINKFTAFEWAIIFYYDFRYNQKERITKKDAIKLFIAKHEVTTTQNCITNDEITIKNSIKNEKINTQEMESVKLFIKDNYEESVFEAIEYDITTINDAQSRT